MKLLIIVFGMMAMVMVLALIGSVFTYWTWNALMPDLFQLPAISLWQAFLMNVLSGILFKTNGSVSTK